MPGCCGDAAERRAGGAKGRELAEDIVVSFPTCSIPEIARPGRALKQWKDAFPGYFTTGGSRHPTLEPRGTEPRQPGRGASLGRGIAVRARVGDLVQPCRGPNSVLPATTCALK